VTYPNGNKARPAFCLLPCPGLESPTLQGVSLAKLDGSRLTGLTNKRFEGRMATISFRRSFIPSWLGTGGEWMSYTPGPTNLIRAAVGLEGAQGLHIAL
jgi:hypothetical protein